MDALLERFLRYVAYNTKAEATASTTPSSPGQMDLARLLAEELRNLGLRDATVDAQAYVTASLPARARPRARRPSDCWRTSTPPVRLAAIRSGHACLLAMTVRTFFCVPV